MKKKKPIWLWVVLGAFILMLLGGAFGGGSYWQSSIWSRKQDSLLQDTKQKQIVLRDSVKQAEANAEALQEAIDKLHNENNYLYGELRKKERALRNSVDTSFISNAKRIKSSVDRYLKAQDSLN